MRWYKVYDEVIGKHSIWDYAQVDRGKGYLFPFVRVIHLNDEWKAYVNYKDGSSTQLFGRPILALTRRLVERWWETVHWHRFPVWKGDVYGTKSCWVRVYELAGDWFIQHEDKHDGVENLHHEKTLIAAKRWVEAWWEQHYGD